LAPKSPAAGLAPRLAATDKLRRVLAGARFIPFGPADIGDPRDRTLANRLVTTALRRQGHLDQAIARLLNRCLPPRAGSFEAVLRLSLAQLLYLGDLGDHSALYLAGEAVKADRRASHLKGLMNAVLRRAQAERERLLALPAEELFPAWLREKWTAQYGAAAVEGFGTALIEGASLDLTMRDDDPALIAALGGMRVAGDTVRVADRDRPIEALPGYAEGRWWVQDAAAALPARLIRLPKGARVLDLCAAPGGKTAQLIKAGYAVTALDADAGRLDRLGGNLRRLGYEAEIVLADAARYRPDEGFDAVLLDAPCSATGTFRRHPEVVWHRSAADLGGRQALQREMLASAARCLKAGGVLVYCVCSLEREEGEDQAGWVAAALDGLAPFPVAPAELGELGVAVTPEGWVRTHPGMRGGGLDGFFILRLKDRRPAPDA
jgi:16S rRNA (cytosine967-C5)-methyltransferase